MRELTDRELEVLKMLSRDEFQLAAEIDPKAPLNMQRGIGVVCQRLYVKGLAERQNPGYPYQGGSRWRLSVKGLAELVERERYGDAHKQH